MNTPGGELTEWVRRYTKELFVWAYQKTADRQLAEDLVQETFLAAAEGRAGFRGDSQPKTWLLGILKNKIAEYYRKMLRQQIAAPLPADDLSAFFDRSGHWEKMARPMVWQDETAQLTDIPAFNQILDRCIDHLPGLMNACIRLRFLDEKKSEEICQDLGITATNYWQLIHRAKLQLRQCLEQNWFRKE